MAQNRKTNIGPLPSVSDYTKGLEMVTDQSIGLCTVKSPTVRIPPAIRAQMRALPRLVTFWQANRSTYTALVEASQQPTKTRSAGA